jgi:regulator of sigma E protease
MLSILINVLLFILVIGILTFVHELGHFIIAKLAKATVDEFALGFGPKLISQKYKETLYSIRMLPLGGYVKIAGDGDPEKEEKKKDQKKDPGNLQNKPRIIQIAVMLAGVIMNLLFAVVVYYIILATSGWQMTLDWQFENFKPTGATIQKVVAKDVEYAELVEGGNAQIAGLPTSGILKNIAGETPEYSSDVGKILGEHKGESVQIEVCNESCNTYTVPVSEEGKIGIALSTNYYVVISYESNKVLAGFSHAINTLRLIGTKLGDLFTQAKTTGDYSELSNSVSGPVGIYFLIDYFKNFGFLTFLNVMGDLSLSLAIMNLLPIPALDGGRVGILIIESIIRKDLDERIKTIIINGSFIFLMILVIFIMIKDVLNIQDLKNMFK